MNTNLFLNAHQRDLISTLYNESKGEILGYILKRVRSLQDAEDMLQDLYLRLLNYNTLLERETMMNFIYKIAKNLIVDYYRHNKYYVAAHNSYMSTLPLTSNVTEEMVAVQEVALIEQRCVDSLSAQRRRVYKLRLQEGESTAEVAAKMNLSQRTVENHLLTARKEMIALVSSFY